MKNGFTLIELLIASTIAAFLISWFGVALGANTRLIHSQQQSLNAQADLGVLSREVSMMIRRRAAPNFLAASTANLLAVQFPSLDLVQDYPNAVFSIPSTAFASCSDLLVIQSNPSTLEPRFQTLATTCVPAQVPSQVLYGVPHPELLCPEGTLPQVEGFGKSQDTLAISACFRFAYESVAAGEPQRIPTKLDVELHALYQSGPHSVSWVHSN